MSHAYEINLKSVVIIGAGCVCAEFSRLIWAVVTAVASCSCSLGKVHLAHEATAAGDPRVMHEVDSHTVNVYERHAAQYSLPWRR